MAGVTFQHLMMPQSAGHAYREAADIEDGEAFAANQPAPGHLEEIA
jgi:hypothetical protein